MYKQGYKRQITVSAQRRKMRNQRKAATVPIYIVFFEKDKSVVIICFYKAKFSLD